MSIQRLHPIQDKLLMLAQERSLGNLSLREIGELVGDRSPQKIKHHIDQLQKKGLLRVDKIKGVIEKTSQGGWIGGFLEKGKRLLKIAIVGAANCGPATLLAETNIEGYLRISDSLINRTTGDGLFAIRADGSSMNRNKIENNTIESGDLVIVDGQDRVPVEDGVYLFVIDGCANIKRFHKDEENNQAVLMSDSSEDFTPIYIHEADDFMVNGRVIQIIKRPLGKSIK